MKRHSIIALGEVLWDLFPDGEQFGGAPANFACQAAVQGAGVTLVSAVGADPHGDEALEILSRYQVDTRLIDRIEGVPTGTVGITLDSARKPTFTIHESAAWDQVPWSDGLESGLQQCDAVYFGTLGQRCPTSRETIRKAVESAAEKGVPRILDINLRKPFFDAAMIRDSIRLASILKLSDDELAEAGGACGLDGNGSAETKLRNLLEFGALEMVVMTRGSKGAVLATSDGVVEQGGVPAEVVDTVGAGDAFTSAFLLGCLQSQPHQENLLHACQVAAAACSHAGAVPPVD